VAPHSSEGWTLMINRRTESMSNDIRSALPQPSGYKLAYLPLGSSDFLRRLDEHCLILKIVLPRPHGQLLLSVACRWLCHSDN
jgi:hypothetical protein